MFDWKLVLFYYFYQIELKSSDKRSLQQLSENKRSWNYLILSVFSFLTLWNEDQLNTNSLHSASRRRVCISCERWVNWSETDNINKSMNFETNITIYSPLQPDLCRHSALLIFHVRHMSTPYPGASGVYCF